MSDRREWTETKRYIVPELRSTEQEGYVQIPEADLALLMAVAARDINHCEVEDCEHCTGVRRVWWDCSNALSGDARVMAQRFTRMAAGCLPPAPWDDEGDS